MVERFEGLVSMNGVCTLTALAGLAIAMVPGLAQATPVTFAQVTDTDSSNGLNWVNDGVGSGTLNTDVTSGDAVNFTFENMSGLPGYLSGQLAAIETINGGLGVTTTAQATQTNFAGATYDTQALNAPMTISYRLADGGSFSNLLTITIVPNMPGASGLVLTGEDGGTGAGATASNKSRPAPTYTETFTSDFLRFTAGSTITAGFSLSALIPEFAIDADGLLSSFGGDVVGTFSADPPPAFVGEPASVALLGVGLLGLAGLTRRRFA